MSKSMKRGIRRHHRERLAKKRSKYWVYPANDEAWMFQRGVYGLKQKQGSLIDTPTPCSCYMCGNPRKHHNEVTLQERISLLETEDPRQISFRGYWW